MNILNNKGNVLVTSISSKIPLLICVKEAISKVAPTLKLYGADVNSSVTGRYFVDEFWEMPYLDILEINELIWFCKSKGIRFIIPTRDGELQYFSKNMQLLEQSGIFVMISCEKSIEFCIDKQSFYNIVNRLGFPVIPTHLTLERNIYEYYVVKERFGAGAESIGLNLTYSQAKKHATLINFPIYQPMIKGTEISVDLYINRVGKVKGVICRTRDKVVCGESQITTIIEFSELEEMCLNMAKILNLYGHIVFQVILDKENNVQIIECNPRFGGASTLSVAAGLDSFYWFFLESMGENLDEYPFVRSNKELTLVRHPQDYIF